MTWNTLPLWRKSGDFYRGSFETITSTHKLDYMMSEKRNGQWGMIRNLWVDASCTFSRRKTSIMFERHFILAHFEGRSYITGTDGQTVPVVLTDKPTWYYWDINALGSVRYHWARVLAPLWTSITLRYLVNLPVLLETSQQWLDLSSVASCFWTYWAQVMPIYRKVKFHPFLDNMAKLPTKQYRTLMDRERTTDGTFK